MNMMTFFQDFFLLVMFYNSSYIWSMVLSGIRSPRSCLGGVPRLCRQTGQFIFIIIPEYINKDTNIIKVQGAGNIAESQSKKAKGKGLYWLWGWVWRWSTISSFKAASESKWVGLSSAWVPSRAHTCWPLPINEVRWQGLWSSKYVSLSDDQIFFSCISVDGDAYICVCPLQWHCLAC